MKWKKIVALGCVIAMATASVTGCGTTKEENTTTEQSEKEESTVTVKVTAVDGDTITRILDAVGIRANWINTGEFRVADEKNNEMFYVNCDTGVVRIKAQQFSLTGESVEEIANKEIDKFVSNIYKTDLEEIKKQLSNKIETWYQDSDPSLQWTGKETRYWYDEVGHPILDIDGYPILITVETEKEDHEGDLWKNSKNNNEYIYRSGNWELMDVPDSVFDEIDGKAQIFIKTPTAPYNVGDLWFTGNEILTCIQKRDDGTYVASDWQKKNNYTDDSAVKSFISNVYDPKIADIQNQIDGKIDTFYYDYEPTMSNAPASGWTTDVEKNKHNGDLFFWKSKGYTYRFLKANNTWRWVRVKDADITSAMTAASNAQDTADGKRRVFTSTPTPPYDTGDLWTQGSAGDLMRCKTSRASGNYVSTDWIKATKYTDDSSVNKLEQTVKSEIEVIDRKIALRVTSEEAQSLIEQKVRSIRLQADEISWKSKYSEMTEDGSLTCQNATIQNATVEGTICSDNGDNKIYLRDGRMDIVYKKKNIGLVGANGFKGYPDAGGINFDLNTEGDYMLWGSQNPDLGNDYYVRWIYVNRDLDRFSEGTLNAGCSIDMHNWTLKNPSFEDGGVTATINFVQILKMNSNGTAASWGNNGKLQYKNGLLIDLNYYVP